jgi:hypothetical protein
MYVGSTKKPINKRLQQHITDSKIRNSKKAQWINSLKESDKYPFIMILEHTSQRLSNLKESYWISCFRKNGFELLNEASVSEKEISKPLKIKLDHSLVIEWRILKERGDLTILSKILNVNVSKVLNILNFEHCEPEYIDPIKNYFINKKLSKETQLTSMN